jgi:hypothetical protein
MECTTARLAHQVWEFCSPAPCEHIFCTGLGLASLSQALHIRITCYYVSLPLDAFQRDSFTV